MINRAVVNRLLGITVGLGLIYFVFTNRGLVTTTMGAIGDLSLPPIGIGLAFSLLAMVNRGWLNHSAHRAVGLATSPAAMTRTSATAYAAHKIVRSGGASSLLVFIRHGRRNGHGGGSVTAACAIAAAAAAGALGVLFSATVAILALTGRFSGLWIAATAGFALYCAVAATVGFIALRNRALAVRLWNRIRSLRSRVWGRTVSPASASDSTALDDLYDALATARSRPVWVRRVMVHALASKSLGALMLMAAVAAAGLPISATQVVVVYATALATASVSVVPSGIGVVEASTAALLIGAGAPPARAAVAVALFRIFDLWLPVVTGALVGRGELRNRDADSPLPPVGRTVASEATVSLPRRVPVPA